MQVAKPLKRFEPILREHSRTELKQVLGISYNTLQRKLTGVNGFTVEEVRQLQSHLGLSDSQTVEIFIK